MYVAKTRGCDCVFVWVAMLPQLLAVPEERQQME